LRNFAIARGATAPITSKETAVKVWEPKFLAEIVAGRDPRIPPDVPKAAFGVTVAEFLDTYYAKYVEAEGLRDPATIRGRLKAIKAVLGNQPVTVLEKPAEVLRFKAAYRKGREVATVNRALSTLRAAINWGRSQDPPYLVTTPFHRFGVTIKTKEETKRDRRIGLHEEQARLAASAQMGGPEHKYVGPAMHDRIIGALETCCRRGEMLADSESARRLGATPDRHPRSSCEGCGESPHSIRPTRTLGARPEASRVSRPKRVRVRIASWRVRGQLQDGLGVVAPDRQRARDEARDTRCARRSRQTAADRPALARPAPSCRLLADGVDIRIIQLMLGHASAQQTQC
jgi:integrase